MSSQTIYVAPGATDQTVYVGPILQDAGATNPGDPLTGLAYNTASLTCYYKKAATDAAAALSLATQTATGAHSDGGFVEIDSTNMPGMYRLDLSDVMLTGSSPRNIITLTGAADMATHTIHVALTVPADVRDWDGTSIPEVDTNGYPVVTIKDGTGAGEVDLSSGKLAWNASWDAEVQSEVQDAIEANHLDHLLAANYDPASKPGVATALLNELVENDSGVSRFTANALEQGPTDVNVTSMAADVLTASALATDAVTEMFTAVVETEGSFTVQQALSIILAACAGVTGSSGNTISTPNGNATRITATTSSNERTAMTLNPSS